MERSFRGSESVLVGISRMSERGINSLLSGFPTWMNTALTECYLCVFPVDDSGVCGLQSVTKETI